MKVLALGPTDFVLADTEGHGIENRFWISMTAQRGVLGGDRGIIAKFFQRPSFQLSISSCIGIKSIAARDSHRIDE